MDELLVTLFEAVANLNQQTKDLTEEINGFEDVYSKDKELLQKQLDDLTVQMDRLIKEAVNAMPKAKDGLDGKDGIDAEVDYELIKEFIITTVGELPKAKNGKNGLDGIDGQDGRDGLDGANGKDGSDGKRGEIGKQGKKGDKGLTGEKGDDGLAIKDIIEKNGYIIITLSDGTKKELKLPSIQKHTNTVRAGGGGDTLSTSRIEIEAEYKIAHATAYKELTYAGSNITNVDIWTNSGKTVKLFSKIIGYNGNNITSTAITDEVNGGTLSKAIVYSGSNISNVTTTYTA